MKRFRLWDKQNSVNMMGKAYTPSQLRAEYAAQTDGECVLQYVSQNVVGGIDNLETLAMIYKVETDGKEPQTALDEIIYKMENPPEPEPTAEDRIAAAMEYQNLMSM